MEVDQLVSRIKSAGQQDIGRPSNQVDLRRADEGKVGRLGPQDATDPGDIEDVCRRTDIGRFVE